MLFRLGSDLRLQCTVLLLYSYTFVHVLLVVKFKAYDSSSSNRKDQLEGILVLVVVVAFARRLTANSLIVTLAGSLALAVPYIQILRAYKRLEHRVAKRFAGGLVSACSFPLMAPREWHARARGRCSGSASMMNASQQRQ